MDGILNIFQSLINEDKEQEENKEDTDIVEIIEHLDNGETTQLNDNVPNVKVKLEEKPKKANKDSDITWSSKELRFKNVPAILLDKVIVTKATFINKAIGFGTYEKTEVEFEKSWIELLGFLIGAIQTRYRNGYIDILASYGITNETVQIRKEQPVYLDNDIANGLEVYKIPMIDMYLEHRNINADLHRSISRALKALGISEMDMILQLENPNIQVKSKTKTSKSGGKKKKEKEEQTPDYSNLIYLLNPTETLKDMVEKIDAIGNGFVIEAFEMDDDIEEFDNNISAITYILSYIIIFYEQRAINALKTCTKKDIIGVVEDNQDYIGIMQKVKLPNSNLYFYSNGLNTEMIKYVDDVFNTIGIDTTSLVIKYKRI